MTIPAYLRVKYGLHAGDEVEVVEVNGALQIVRAKKAESSVLLDVILRHPSGRVAAGRLSA